ncbi:MAG: hypothetical protein Q7V62_02405 [Actinomycetota bacterium]|nr:hypothetical protein [Actinomycetota bacterium]MDP2291152.1 hypothetical protein [Actinomycetota bacterium]
MSFFLGAFVTRARREDDRDGGTVAVNDMEMYDGGVHVSSFG